MNHRYRSIALVFLLLTFGSVPILAQDTVRVCTYNLLRFGGDDTARVESFRRVLNQIEPTILLVQEITSEDGFLLFRYEVAAKLETPLLARVIYDQEGDTWTAVYYDPERVTLIDTRQFDRLVTRSLTSYTFQVHGTEDTIVGVTAHFKAGDTPEDRDRRLLEARTLRIGEFNRILEEPDWFTAGDDSLFFFAGDLNVYDADEPAYRVLTLPELDSNEFSKPLPERSTVLYDPIQRPGDWHNNADFADLHSQSTRARQFGGGVSGGMDDRFDQILVSEYMLPFVDSSSYTTFGNDGNHFNDSINAPTNTAVSAEIAQALHDASDHLPVFVDFVFGGVMSVEVREASLFQLNLAAKSNRTSHTYRKSIGSK